MTKFVSSRSGALPYEMRSHERVESSLDCVVRFALEHYLKRFEQKGTSDYSGCLQDIQHLRFDTIYTFSYHALDTFEGSKFIHRADRAPKALSNRYQPPALSRDAHPLSTYSL